MHHSRFTILNSYWFLGGLLLLLLNDFILKPTFGNVLTGKLSDFAGLFVFYLFFSHFFKNHKKLLICIIAILFTLWKSPLSGGFISVWNSYFSLTLSRVVDYSDLIALSVLPFAYFISKKKHYLTFITIHPILPGIIAVFAFSATSYQKNFDYDKVYEIPIGKEELIQRTNTLPYNSDIPNLPISSHIENANQYFTIEYDDSIPFYVSGYTHESDTIYKSKSKEIDTIYHYKIAHRDTMYINNEGIFFHYFPDRKYFSESKTGYCNHLNAKLKISGNLENSQIKLIKVYTSNCYGMFEKEIKNKEEEYLLKAFEKEFIEKLTTP